MFQPAAPVLGTVLAALPASYAAADGNPNGTIGSQYGAPMAIDADNDGSCANTGDRGDIIDFHAFNDGSNRWNFAFVVDSANPPDQAGGPNRVDYWIPIDTGTLGTPQMYFNSSPNWGRQFGVTGNYFIRCQSNDAISLACSMYNPGGGDTLATISVIASTTLGGRRYIDLQITNDNGTGVNANSAIGTMVISGYDARDAGFPWYSLDAAGGNSPEGISSACGGGEFVFRDYTDNNITTAANCNTTGRPTDVGATNNRQCASLPARTTTTGLTDITTCNATSAGVVVNGAT